MKYELTPGAEVVKPMGPGTLERIKPGNLRKQDYQVKLPNGQTRWYSRYELEKAFKMAA